MSTPITDSLPPGLRELRTRPLLALRLDVRAPMRVVAVGTGQRRSDGPVYSVFEVL